MLVTCLNCNQLFDKSLSEIRRSPNHFCNRNCAAACNNKGRRRHPVIFRTCTKCSQTFLYIPKNRNRKRCSECSRIYLNSDRIRRMTLAELWSQPSVKGKHPSWRNSHIRLMNRLWNADLLKKPCAVCGYKLHVELCHIRAISDFPESTLIEEVNHPSNVIQLCPNHHWELDNGYLKLQDIPRLDSSRTIEIKSSPQSESNR